MKVIPDFKATTIIPFLTQNVTPGSTIYTDGLKSFAGVSEAGFKHVARNQPLRSELRKGAKSAVPLADRAIGNLQQWLIGTYHGVSKAQLQVYLDEFVFRHNRRKTPAAAFQSLLGLGTARKSTKYEQIRGARDLNPNLLGRAEATDNQKAASEDTAREFMAYGSAQDLPRITVPVLAMTGSNQRYSARKANRSKKRYSVAAAFCCQIQAALLPGKR